MRFRDLCKDRKVNEFVCIFQGIMKEIFERHVPLSVKDNEEKAMVHKGLVQPA
jgi:hypothetical protein